MIFNLLVVILDYLYLMKEGEILTKGLQRRPSPLAHCKLYTESSKSKTWAEDQQAMIHYL